MKALYFKKQNITTENNREKKAKEFNLFFDIDDVLFPSTKFSREARKNALNAMIEMGLEEKYEKLSKLLREIIKEKGSNYPKHFDVLLERLGIEKKKRARYIAAAVRAYHDTKATIHPYPDVPKTLLTLQNKYPLYIATDGIAIKQWDKLLRMGLALFFKDVFVSEELEISKSEEFYKKISKLLNVKGENCIMIGDREDKDILPAKKAGWYAIRVRRKDGKYSKGKTIADAEIDNLNNLPEIINMLKR